LETSRRKCSYGPAWCIAEDIDDSKRWRLSARPAKIFDMRNATHEAIGAAMALAVCAALDSGAAMAAGALGASVLGSRLPDVDQPRARIHRRTRLERRSIGVGLAVGALRLPMAMFARVGRHRGATHWLLSGAAATLVLAAAARAIWAPLAIPVAIGIGCGYWGHLLADACTPHGAPLLGPLHARRVHLLPAGRRIVTGARGDLLLMFTAALTAVVLGLAVVTPA
jgi:membrane-bound metal-dependent hydrolase YbcI (DUF457 family)